MIETPPKPPPPKPATSTDPPKPPAPEREDEKRIERFPERYDAHSPSITIVSNAWVSPRSMKSSGIVSPG